MDRIDMPYTTVIRKPSVYHIGHLDRRPEERSPTVDGPCIAVSVHPESWRQIKGLNGPQYRLNYSPAQWVDVMSFNASDRQDIEGWMVRSSYMEPAKVWVVDYYDSEQDDFVTRTFEDFAQAAAVVGRTPEEEREAAQAGQGALMEQDGFRLTRRAMARLGGVSLWPDHFCWMDAAVLIYTREVVLKKRPFVVGVWWDIPNNPSHGMAPYGLIFPERAHLFEVEDEDGCVHEFLDYFKEFPVPA